MVLAYTYINTEVIEDNELPVGTPLLNVPANSLSVWMKYTLQDGPSRTALQRFGKFDD